MKTDVYQPPAADLETESQQSKETDKFYVVSTPKFFTLYIGTFGLYSVFWFYANWRLYRLHTKEHIWPVARAIFSIFFAHSLFNEIEHEIRVKKIKHAWSATLWATIYVVAMLASNIIDRLNPEQDELTSTDGIVLGLAIVTMFSLFRTQKAINISQNDPLGSRNNQFTVYNILWITLFLGLFAYFAFLTAEYFL